MKLTVTRRLPRLSSQATACLCKGIHDIPGALTVLAARAIDRSIGTRFFATPTRLQKNFIAGAAAQIAPTLKLSKISNYPVTLRVSAQLLAALVADRCNLAVRGFLLRQLAQTGNMRDDRLK